MAVARAGNNNCGVAGGTQWGGATDGGSGANRLLICFSCSVASSVTSVTWNGSGLTEVASQGNLKCWVMVNPASGTRDIYFNYTPSGSLWICYQFFDGVDQGTAYDTIVTNSGNSTTLTTGSVTCPANGMIHAFLHGNYTNFESITVTDGTEIGGARTGVDGSVGTHGYRTTTGAYAGGVNSATDFQTIGVPIRAAASDSPVVRILNASGRAVLGRASEW